MFNKNIIQGRKPVSISIDEIMEDIKRIQMNDDQRNKLYFCLDEKPPYDKRFKNLEDFLKGNVDLESVSESLQALTEDLKILSIEILGQVSNIKTKSIETLKSI